MSEREEGREGEIAQYVPNFNNFGCARETFYIYDSKCLTVYMMNGDSHFSPPAMLDKMANLQQ